MTIGTYQTTPVLTLVGHFDVLSAPEVRARWPTLLTDASPNLLVDMRGVEFIDSMALATLVSGLRAAQRVNGFFRLVGLQPTVRFVFEITRLTQAFELYDDEAAALAGPHTGATA